MSIGISKIFSFFYFSFFLSFFDILFRRLFSSSADFCTWPIALSKDRCSYPKTIILLWKDLFRFKGSSSGMPWHPVVCLHYFMLVSVFMFLMSYLEMTILQMGFPIEENFSSYSVITLPFTISSL